MKYVIIGGVAGGATAAARIRRIDENAQIILIEKGKYISYANCGLPYYIGGTISDRSRLFVQTPASFGGRFNVEVRTESEAVGIDTGKKQVTIKGTKPSEANAKSGSSETYVESYDKLLLSPGSYPVKPPLDGIDSEGIFTLRNVDDTDAVKEYLGTHKVTNAVVVGGGFIGLEMADNLVHSGAKVSIIEMSDQVMAPVDFSIASFIHRHLLDKGVDLFLNKGVKKFERTPADSANATAGKIKVFYGEQGESLETDLVVLSIGVRPNTALAASAGLKIGEARGIWVDEHLQTSAKDVYAVGDAIEYPNPITGKPWIDFLAAPANRQARLVADNMVLGDKEKYEGAIGTCIAKVFDMTVASTGLPAKRLEKEGIKYLSSVTHSACHAGYYPGAKTITIKLTFATETGKLYGAQAVGFDGVDKRIDEIALAIKNGGTVYDLMSMEHSYAPPFSSAKDPVAIAGYAAGNILNGTMPVITWRELKKMVDEKMQSAAPQTQDFVLIDVRTVAENSLGSIPGSINIPVDEMRGRLSEIPADKPIVVYCKVGLRGYLAQRILMGHGFKDVRNLSGGYTTYETATAPIENCPPEGCPTRPQVPGIDPDTQRVDSMPRSAQAISSSAPKAAVKTVKIDACGLSCPGPIMKLKENIDSLTDGDRIEVTATDPGFSRDAAAWCRTTGNTLLSQTEANGNFTAVIEKKMRPESIREDQNSNCNAGNQSPKGKTLIMFDDDLDKAIATFILANGAAATGAKTSIFFTFWGLNVIKKANKPKVHKDIWGKMFSMMLAGDSTKLGLSKMNMCGIGAKMMRKVMKVKNIDTLESLRDQARRNGVEFIACQMSMDVMGVKKEELLDGVTIGGVATYMERADQANMSLFI
jgi:NADPH-dependent 2,4-dienoyl-CoA reductase/sulfur reductase-like enzyme/peroxiredoxin family protein/rhodanese-related sulfurtransferase/TusA-related sulfurtransferase